jgi:hypothetical protein
MPSQKIEEIILGNGNCPEYLRFVWHQPDIKKEIIKIDVAELDNECLMGSRAIVFHSDFILYIQTTHKVFDLLNIL